MRALLLSKRAEADLRAIWRYSFESWGELQADHYLDALDEGLRRCAAEPGAGKPRDALRPGCRSMPVRKHVLFYTFTDGEVLILRVLHGSMDPARHV